MRARIPFAPVGLAWGLTALGAAFAWWSDSRMIEAACVTGAYLCACVGMVGAHRRRNPPRLPIAALQNDDITRDMIIVAHASQTGSAERLARQAYDLLTRAGARATCCALGELNAQRLAAHSRVFLIVSTTGEGDAPDAAVRFVRETMHQSLPGRLSTIEFGMLALGDRHYPNFCAFGRRLAGWLGEQGAKPLFAPIEVDNGDVDALRDWQARLRDIVASHDDANAPASAAIQETQWTLAARTLLNPGSAGAPVFDIELKPRAASSLVWQAGDIVEVRPSNDAETVRAWREAWGFNGTEPVVCDGVPMTLEAALCTRALSALSALPPEDTALSATGPQDWIDCLTPIPRRSYTIASLPGEGRLKLLVRQRHLDVNGTTPTLGVGSGWLTAHAPPGGEIVLRIRTNRGFHEPDRERPQILIGNGTGLAGLRAHLKAREQADARRNWLIVGERHAAHDAFWSDEIETMRRRGVIERLDRAWSRDAGSRRYVQDVLAQQASVLRDWVEDGASIYVCGSAHGMAPAVDAAIRVILGDARVDELLEAHRYRRDVY